MSSGASSHDLRELLERHRPRLTRFLTRNAANLLRWEEIDDLVQDVQLRALRAEERFEYQGEGAFMAWLIRLARQHCADRFDHWRALKRGSGKVLRLTWTGSETSSGPGAFDPAASMTGPVTHAWRREQLVVATRALGLLSERDRALVQWASEGVTLGEQAERLGISYDAAEQAGRRAQGRFRRTFELLVQRGRP